MHKKVNTKLIKRVTGDRLKVLLLLLDDIAVLVLIILILRFWEVRIPLPITIAAALAVGTFVFIINKAVVRSFHKTPVAGPEAMIGIQGRVVKPLTPVGTIIVNGEYWRAESVNGNMGVNEVVEILGLEGLTLKVKRKEP